MIRWLVAFFLGMICTVTFFQKHMVGEKITGIYTDMEFHENSGDVTGTEVFLVRARQGYFVVFQWAEGSPSVPVVVPAKLEGGGIVFEIPEKNDGLSGVFKGRIYGNSLRGQFENGALNKNGEKIFFLNKKNSYWQ